MRLLWTPGAGADMKDAYDYIAADNAPAARRLMAKIRRTMRDTHRFPELGKVVSEFGLHAIRERIVDTYRVIYEVRPSEIRVIAVVHARRGLPDLTRVP